MANNTTNLGLYKKDPATDGADTFNIQTMLNENWDKVDAHAGDTTKHITGDERTKWNSAQLYALTATDGTPKTTTATDVNKIITTGVYSLAYTVSNLPVMANTILNVIARTSSNIYQEAIEAVPITTYGRIFWRVSSDSGATWSAWQTVESISHKNIANGYPGLDSSARILPAQLPTSAPLQTTADLTYYVSTTGSDSNAGTSSSTPFLTIAKAISMIPPIVNHTVTVNIAAGTYAETVRANGYTGIGYLYLTGDSAAATNIVNSIVRNVGIPITVSYLTATIGAGIGFYFEACVNASAVSCASTVSSLADGSWGIQASRSRLNISGGTYSNRWAGVRANGASNVYIVSATGAANNYGIWISEGSFASTLSVTIAATSDQYHYSSGGTIVRDGTLLASKIWVAPATSDSPAVTLPIGDNDTGFNWNSDGYLDFFTNGTVPAALKNGEFIMKGPNGSYYASTVFWGEHTKDYRSLVTAIRNASNQTGSASVYTNVIFDYESADVKGEYDPSTGYFTALQAGIYAVIVQAKFTATSGYDYYIHALVNSATEYPISRLRATATADMGMNGVTLLNLSAGDTFRIRFYGTYAWTLYSGSANTRLMVVRVA